MKTPEGYEKDAIKKYLDSINAWYFCPFMTGFGKSGVADIIACIDGFFWSIEVKRDGKVPTNLQMHRVREVRAAGGKACWGTAGMVYAAIEQWRNERLR